MRRGGFLPGVRRSAGRGRPIDTVHVNRRSPRPPHARRDAAFVSLRVTAKDTAGNAIEQEVIRAYGLGDSRHRGF